MDKTGKERAKNLRRKIDRFMLWSSMTCALLILYIIGYNTDPAFEAKALLPIELLIYTFDVLLCIRVFSSLYFKRTERLSFYSEIILFLYLTLVIVARIYPDPFRFLDLDASPCRYSKC